MNAVRLCPYRVLAQMGVDKWDKQFKNKIGNRDWFYFESSVRVLGQGIWPVNHINRSDESPNLRRGQGQESAWGESNVAPVLTTSTTEPNTSGVAKLQRIFWASKTRAVLPFSKWRHAASVSAHFIGGAHTGSEPLQTARNDIRFRTGEDAQWVTWIRFNS